MLYDLKIAGGVIVDGSGEPGRRDDLYISDGKIVRIGGPDAAARAVIDAAGKVVAPGFVDIHTHYDAQVMWDRGLSVSAWHGATTVVVGNCGFGIAPCRPEHRDLVLRTLENVEAMSLEALRAGLGETWPFETFAEYLDAIEADGVALNIAVLVGHTPIRLAVMGEDAVRRPASEEEIGRMADLVRDAMAQGAIGFATSQATSHNAFDGHPVPSRMASLDEIQTLAMAMAETGRGIVQATVGPGLFIPELTQLAKLCGRPVTWTALLSGLGGPGAHRRMLEETAAAHVAGAKVVPQVSCRPLTFDFDFEHPYPFESLPAFHPALEAVGRARLDLLSDPSFRLALKQASGADARHAMAGWETRTFISRNRSAPDTEGQLVADAARQAGVDPLDFVLDLSLATDLQTRFRMYFLNHQEDEVAELLDRGDKDCVIALSDAGAHASQLCDTCYSTHLLGRWVRERGLMSVERAVHMLTRRPAELFGLQDRGLLAPGLAADIVIFDPETVGHSDLRRVNDLPAGAERLVVDAFGIQTVIVNGQVIRHDDQDIALAAGALPGRLLRGGGHADMAAMATQAAS